MKNTSLRNYIASGIFAMLGISCYILADTYFISVAAGANGITALNLALPVYGIMFALGSMIGIGFATYYSLGKAMQRKDTEDCFFNALAWSFLISLIFILSGIFVPDKVLQMLGADAEILKTGQSYIRTALICAPFFMLNYSFTSFVRNDGAPKIAMAATLSSSFFNIVFDYVLMFPLGMGMFGAALATGLSPLVSILVCMMHYLSDKNTIRLKWGIPSFKLLLKACPLGIAGFIGEISSAVTNLTFNFLLLKLTGNIGVAAYGVVANVSLVGIAVFNGISQGLQPLSSEAEGKNDEKRKKEIYRYSIVVGIIMALIMVAICWCFTGKIVDVFNSEQSKEMEHYAITGMRIYCIGFLMAGINIVRAGYYGAIGKAKECFVISISRGVVAIVLFALILSGIFGIYGVWLAFPASELFTCLGFAVLQVAVKSDE